MSIEDHYGTRPIFDMTPVDPDAIKREIAPFLPLRDAQITFYRLSTAEEHKHGRLWTRLLRLHRMEGHCLRHLMPSHPRRGSRVYRRRETANVEHYLRERLPRGSAN